MTMFLGLERFCWWVNIALCSIHFTCTLIHLCLPTVAIVTVTFLWHLSHGLDGAFRSAVADLSDIGRFDWCGPGPHEGSLPDKCQPHDAEHQHVVHSGAGTRWVQQPCFLPNSRPNEYVPWSARKHGRLHPKPKLHRANWHTCSQRGETNQQNYLDMVQYCQNMATWNRNTGALNVLLRSNGELSENAKSNDFNIC